MSFKLLQYQQTFHQLKIDMVSPLSSSFSSSSSSFSVISKIIIIINATGVSHLSSLLLASTHDGTRRRERVLNKRLYREAPPRGPTPHPFIYKSSRCIPSIVKWYPFHNLFSTKSICQPFWALSQTQMTDLPTLLYTSTCQIPTLSYTCSLNKIPLSGGASPYRPS